MVTGNAGLFHRGPARSRVRPILIVERADLILQTFNREMGRTEKPDVGVRLVQRRQPELPNLLILLRYTGIADPERAIVYRLACYLHYREIRRVHKRLAA